MPTKQQDEHDGAIYLDYAATTPVDPAVLTVMLRYLGPSDTFGNPASRSHAFGWRAAEAVEGAREKIANLINAEPRDIVWTSGATESNNLAIKGVAKSGTDRGRHIVTSLIEHRAVLDPCRYLESDGFRVTYLEPDRDGLITPEQVKRAIRPDTVLVTLMHVNNEIGTITDVGAIGSITRQRDIPLHVDAAQSAARLPLDVAAMRIDLMSLSGHKIYGPKGVGALYVRHGFGLQIQPQMHGGGHERGLRAGTLATHQLVGMGEAAHLVAKRRDNDVERARSLEHRLVDSLGSIDRTFFNGNGAPRVPGLLNVGFECVDSEPLMMALKNSVAISSGAACTSSKVEPSHVLRGLGLGDHEASCSVRVSIGRFTTKEEIDAATSHMTRCVAALRRLSPGWSSNRPSPEEFPPLASSGGESQRAQRRHEVPSK